MKIKILFTSAFVLLALTACAYAQATEKAPTALDAAMKKFIGAIKTKNTPVFLSFISQTKGLTIMNTIDQGDAGNADKPMFDSKITYKKLSADLKGKRGVYSDMFKPSKEDPNFYDAFAGHTEKWLYTGNNTFMLADETGQPSKVIYVKWAKEGTAWKAIEAGRMIS